MGTVKNWNAMIHVYTTSIFIFPETRQTVRYGNSAAAALRFAPLNCAPCGYVAYAHMLALLAYPRNCEKAEAEVVAGVARLVPVAVRGRAALGVVGPAAAPEHAGRTSGLP